jgi:putative ABC transport system permease protein
MLRSYLLATYRNLIRHKTYSLINVFGLSLGMAACFYIFHYVHFERSYDAFNKNSDRLYRVITEWTGGNEAYSAATHVGVSQTMKEELPEVEAFTRLVNISLFYSSQVFSYTPAGPGADVKSFHENRIFLADEAFFKMFSYPLLQGDPNTCLDNADAIAISATLARKYFGNENPIGKTLRFNDLQSLKVTAVFEDVTDNSHIKFDAVIAISLLGPRYGYGEFAWPEFYNYVLLKQGADAAVVQKKLVSFSVRHLQKLLAEYNYTAVYRLQKVSDIHLTSHFEKEAEMNGSAAEVSFLSIIGVFILIIAWINYINLCTVKAIDRGKEVGLRKVVGASSKQLFTQFLVESFVVNTIALFFAALLVLAAWPFCARFLDKDINSGFFQNGLGSFPGFWLAVAIIFVAGALVVGVYPAMILSSFKPTSLFRTQVKKWSSGLLLRKGLVTFQYMLSILLIGATVIVYGQLRYSRLHELGYNASSLLIVKTPARSWAKLPEIHRLQNAIRETAGVENVALSSDIPGEPIRYQNAARHTYDTRQSANWATNLIEIDENFFPTYKVAFAGGRNFITTDTMQLFSLNPLNVIINERLAKDLGFVPAASAVNKQIICILGVNDRLCNVVGVINNFHQKSVRDKFEQMLFYYPNISEKKYLSVKLRSPDVKETINAIEKNYKNVFPGNPFEYFFLDDYFNKQYAPDVRLGKVFMLFIVLAIIVACLGLWGLSGFTLRLRVKEVGIRKVLGASVNNLLLLLTKDYMRLAAIAAVVTMPVIYYFSHRWLDNFAFHFTPGLFVMVLPSLLLLVITLSTVIFQTVKASLETPVKALKAE